jgi:hypothetical protein
MLELHFIRICFVCTSISVYILIGDLGLHKKESLSLNHRVQTGSEAPPCRLSKGWVPGARTPEIKRLGRVADHSPPSTAEVKNACSYAYTPPYVFIE